MARYDFDLFTIGGGSGGVAASRRAGSYGAKVGLCEDRDLGGTCVHRGCVPKKLLVYGSHFHEEFQDAAGYGWTVQEPAFDWARLREAKDKELARLGGVYARLLRDSGVTVVQGRGRLVDAHTVEVGGKRYTAERILLATGSRPYLPPDVAGIGHALTSDDALSFPELPKRLAIVGGGYIGVELAGIFHGLGSKVTVIVRSPTVLNGFDDDVRAFLTGEMRKKGIELVTDTFIRDIEKRVDGVSLLTRGGDTIEADAVLYATGRVPNSGGLGLEEVGVELDARGAVKVDEWSRTSVENIYAVGDLTDRINLTPVAIAEGRAMAETLFHNNPMKMDHTNVPSAVFSQPPVACVGLTELEARERCGQVDVYVANFKPMKHTLSGRDERTMMKLVVERATQRVLGCHMVGADAPEIIQGLAVAVKCGATKAQFDSTVGIHPTAAEEFVTMREKRPDPETRLAAERGHDAGATGSH
ncbi:glutathione-disulfide reductase [Myxococcus sp. RHSTA-1-4]|uniref:glutathione-disulfide reductase n=1 Tax=Myxococcus sp. RHSTA-1-4 TaxID=2874601 RepID=UPI001CBC78C1|nr:glutathione-disulfide reductase [Myxococcus sp. RHSTA-1-4]MBZ4422294.1 glutathione-disulfide reductase [Myxococcus sp. RHSTA-1-4]